MDDHKGLAIAIEEARIGFEEGGVPVSKTFIMFTHIYIVYSKSKE
jgi:hypothetical protein